MRWPDFLWRYQDSLRKNPEQKLSEQAKQSIQSNEEEIRVVIITIWLCDGEHLPDRLEKELRTKFQVQRLKVRCGGELVAALTPTQIKFVIKKGYVKKVLTTEEYLAKIESEEKGALAQIGELNKLDEHMRRYREQFTI